MDDYSIPWLNFRAHQPSKPSHTKLQTYDYNFNQFMHSAKTLYYYKAHSTIKVPIPIFSPDNIENWEKLFIGKA